MSEIDIRNCVVDVVNCVRFNGNGDNYPIASVIVKRENAVGINITDSDYDPVDDDCNIGFVVVEDKVQANNLIIALQKSIELGWLN